MYTVTSDYMKAVKAQNRKSYIAGTLTTTSGAEYPLNDSTFIKDSVYVENQCVNNNAFEYGAVYLGECGFIINSKIDRYDLFDSRVKMSHFLLVGDKYVEIPLGVFYVDSATRKGSKIKVTALDSMSKLDVSVVDETNGSWYDMLLYAANKCEIELAQTQAELEALHVNARNSYTIKSADVDTYRDVVSYLCMLVCGFATIDRFGKLKIVQYGVKSVDNNDRSTRLQNCSFSDYSTKYNAVTARFKADENFYPYTAKDDDIDGLMLDLGDIPIVGGTPETKQALLDEILKTLKVISYVPASLYIPSNPAYDLGDMIQCDNVNNSTDSINTYIMSYSFGYRNKEKIEAYGKNPRLQNVKDKNSKQISNIESQMSGKDVAVVSFVNSAEYVVKDLLKDIVNIKYTAVTSCKPIYMVTVPFSIDLDGEVEFSIYKDAVAIENAVYTGYYTAGKHVATFIYVDEAAEADVSNMVVKARSYKQENDSVIRLQDASIKTLRNAFNVVREVSTGDIIDYDTSKWTACNFEAGKVTSGSDYLISSFIPVSAGVKYGFTSDGVTMLNVAAYDKKKTYVSTLLEDMTTADFTTTIPNGVKYIRLIAAVSGKSMTVDMLDSICWQAMADISAGEVEPDKTEPTVTIDKYAIKACVYAQGLDKEAAWDGTIVFAEDFNKLFEFNSMQYKAFSEDVATNMYIPSIRDITETFGLVSMGSMSFNDNITDTVEANKIIEGWTFSTANKDYYSYERDCIDTTADNFKMQTVFVSNSYDVSVDRGFETCVTMNTSKFATINNITVEEVN